MEYITLFIDTFKESTPRTIVEQEVIFEQVRRDVLLTERFWNPG